MQKLKNFLIITYGQMRYSSVFVNMLERYARDNKFRYSLLGHAWSDHTFSISNPALTNWDSIMVTKHPEKIDLPRPLRELRKKLVFQYENSWPCLISPNSNPLLAVSSFLMACDVCERYLQEAKENPQILIFMRTDSAFDYHLSPNFIIPQIDSLLYPIGPRRIREEIHYNAFVMTLGFFRLFTSRSQLNLKTSMEGISSSMVESNSISFCGESFFFHLFKAFCSDLRMLPLPWLISDRIVRHSGLTPFGNLAIIRRDKLSIYRYLLRQSKRHNQAISELNILLPVQHTNYAYEFKTAF